MSQYDEVFFDYVNRGAIASANILLPILHKELPIQSVLDVGCGEGGWLHVWQTLGVKDVFGIDGDYVIRDRLLIPKDRFQAEDLAQPFSLSRRFDLVQSLEVGEHLPEASASAFVGSLVAHTDMVLFSAAVVGQGGDQHINEQPLSYWRQKFAEHGFVPVDAVRPHLHDHAEIEPWYRYNAVLYVRDSVLSELSDALRDRVVGSEEPIHDYSPPLYRVRKQIIKCLPTSFATFLAKQKERMTMRKASREQQQQDAV